MFDRVESGIELDYDNFEKARETMSQLERDGCVADMAAAADYARQAGKVGIVGYCWGGSMADLAACHGIARLAADGQDADRAVRPCPSLGGTRLWPGFLRHCRLRPQAASGR